MGGRAASYKVNKFAQGRCGDSPPVDRPRKYKGFVKVS